MTNVAVIIENISPAAGTFVTPVWVGFHDGQFDTYDRGRPVSPGLESLAEDGATGLISTEFDLSGFGAAQGTLGSAPIAPGTSVFQTFTLDSNNPQAQYFNYATMILPSNDAFVANGNPLAFDLFDGGGNFTPIEFIVSGSDVLDAGTEVNDEIPANTAFFGQQSPNTGADQNGVVASHPGFLPPGSGGILDDPMFANSNFLAPGYQVLRITLSEVQMGTAGPDTLAGTNLNDVILGLQGDDTLTGGIGNDNLNGNQGTDSVAGGEGNDTVRGGQNDDIVIGDAGNDTIWGDLGNDVLTGGTGSDLFVFRAGDGADEVTDFEDGIDLIALSGGIGFSNLTFLNEFDGVAIVLNNAEVLATLTGITAAQLSVSDFIELG